MCRQNDYLIQIDDSETIFVVKNFSEILLVNSRQWLEGSIRNNSWFEYNFKLSGSHVIQPIKFSGLLLITHTQMKIILQENND